MDEEIFNEEQLSNAAGADAQNLEETGSKNFEGSSDLGKFKSTQDLFEAYKNLEAQFTKKSQKLSELEKENLKADNTLAVPALKQENLKEIKTGENYFTKEELANDDEFLQQYILSNPHIKDEVFKQCLETVVKAPKLISGERGSEINIAVKKLPKSLEEARMEAEKIFK